MDMTSIGTNITCSTEQGLDFMCVAIGTRKVQWSVAQIITKNWISICLQEVFHSPMLMILDGQVKRRLYKKEDNENSNLAICDSYSLNRAISA